MGEKYSLTCVAIGKMEKIEHWIEELISGTHEKEEWSGSVVETQQGILLFTNIFVRCLAKNIGGVKMNPMAGNIHNHDQLKNK